LGREILLFLTGRQFLRNWQLNIRVDDHPSGISPKILDCLVPANIRSAIVLPIDFTTSQSLLKTMLQPIPVVLRPLFLCDLIRWIMNSGLELLPLLQAIPLSLSTFNIYYSLAIDLLTFHDDDDLDVDRVTMLSQLIHSGTFVQHESFFAFIEQLAKPNPLFLTNIAKALSTANVKLKFKNFDKISEKFRQNFEFFLNFFRNFSEILSKFFGNFVEIFQFFSKLL
jgi:hypothetical protein